MHVLKKFSFAVLATLLPFYVAATAFITTWKTDNQGLSNNTSITIPTTGGGYDYDVDWNNDGTFDELGLTGNVTHDFGAPGTYTIRIRGDFPRVYFNNEGDRQKIISIDQWGDISWTNMQDAFSGCINLTYNATDAPDLSNVTNLSRMFYRAESFNGDLSNWNVQNVTKMEAMFSYAFSFNGDLSSWDVQNVKNLTSMFAFANSFNADLSDWDVQNVTKMGSTFYFASSFNADLSDWDVQNVTDMSNMFTNANAFNADLSNWDVQNVTNMSNMFDGARSFNADLSNWDVHKVTDMSGMFQGTESFNADLSNWDVQNVTTMRFMFDSAESFNADLSSWEVHNVTDMGGLFSGAIAFNGDISTWNVQNVTDMSFMFDGASSFNGELSNWDVQNVTNMSNMFREADAFNGDITDWEVHNVTRMTSMFERADAFNQDLSAWNIGKVAYMEFMFGNCGMDVFNYDQTLIGWASQSVKSGVGLGAEGLDYCLGEDARNTLINTHGWAITGDTKNCEAYNEPPVAMCQSITVDADANCEAQVAANAFDDGSSDPNLDPLTFSITPEAPYPIGTTNVVLTVEDIYSATSECTATITVADNTPPSPVCLHPTISFNGELSIALPEAEVLDNLASTDNCGTVSFVSVSPNQIDCDQVGNVVPVTVTVADANNNTASCIANVTIGGLPCGWYANEDGINCTEGTQSGYEPGTEHFSLTAEGCYDPNYYSNSDAQGMIQQELCGDGEIIAHVTDIDGDAWAGIFMRESNDPGAKMLQLALDNTGLAQRKLRTTTGGYAFNHLFQNQGKFWLRLTRSGSQFGAYLSLDGSNWNAVFLTNIPMTNCIQTGLFLSNATPGSTATAWFDNVQIKPPNGQLAMDNEQHPTSQYANTPKTQHANDQFPNDPASNTPMTNPQSPFSQYANTPKTQYAKNPLQRNITLYPNPTDGEVHVVLSDFMEQPLEIAVYNQQGQMVKRRELPPSHSQTERIRLYDLKNGLYLIQVRSETHSISKKISLIR